MCKQNWSIFLKISFSLQKEEDLRPKKPPQKNNNKKMQIYVLTTGPILLRNMLGPVFNLYLDQFFTHSIYYVFLFFFVFGRNHCFIVFQQKMQNLKTHTHKKEKKTPCVNAPVLTALVKMSVFFFLHFLFWGFRNSKFSRDVF